MRARMKVQGADGNLVFFVMARRSVQAPPGGLIDLRKLSGIDKGAQG